MSLQIYPAFLDVSGRGLTYNVSRRTINSTLKHDAPSGNQVRIQQYSQPMYEWTLTYDYLKNVVTDKPPKTGGGTYPYTDMQILQGFCNAMYGSGQSFLYNDPNWNSVGPGLSAGPTPNLFAQLQVVHDGSNYFAPIQIHYGGLTGTDVATGFFEDVTDIQPAGGNDHSAFSLYDNGTLLTYGTDYTITGPGLSGPGYGFLGAYVVFTAMPTGPVTATFSYYYRCTFSSDDMEFEQFMSFLFCLGGSHAQNSGSIKLITARPPGL